MKILGAIIGFGLGLFMVVNGFIVFNRYRLGIEWTITPSQKLFSSIITFATGAVLVLWTYLLIRKKEN